MDETEIITRLVSLEERVKVIENATAGFSKLSEQVVEMNLKLDMLVGQVTALSSRLSDLEKVPADKWSTVVKTTITVVLSAAIGYIVSRFIPG